MPSTTDRPGVLTLPDEMLGGFGGFPDRVFLISVGNDKYAANNVAIPDGGTTNGLACFPSPDDATTYMGLLAGLSGEIMAKSFDEAREIAISKPILSCILLFVDGKIADIHWVR